MELKKLPHDVSKVIIEVTLQLVWKNSAAEDRMLHEKMAQKQTSLFRLDLPINLQKFGVTERLFLTLHVKWKNLGDEKCIQPKTQPGFCNKS